MTLDWVTLSIPMVIFVATITRAAFGFGGALVAMPLLTLTLGIHTATPLVALINNTSSIIILLSSWREVNMGSAWRLVVSSLLGIPIGLIFLTGAYEGTVKACLAVIVVAFALYNLFKPTLTRTIGQNMAFVFGFFAGILGGAYNANGPLVVAYGTLRHWPTDKFRATLQGYFFPIGLLILAGHALAGLWTVDVLRYYLFSLPFVFLAHLVGSKVTHMMPTRRFELSVNILLIIVSVMMVAP
ncbi:MAG: sulfite exporter TauE/SafE family protein [Anaerolineae bacterium]|nr:sulfite exporter TauE/SafE family protein [Anaerolineae bacterium]